MHDISFNSINDHAIIPLSSSSSLGRGGQGEGVNEGVHEGVQYIRIYPLSWSSEGGPLFSEDSKKSGLALVGGRVGAMRVSVRGLSLARNNDQDQEEDEGVSNEGTSFLPPMTHHNHTHPGTS